MTSTPTTPTPPRMRPQLITADWYEDDVELEAFVFPGENWNGWSVPHFTKAAAEYIVEQQAVLILEDFEVDRLEWDGDKIVKTTPKEILGSDEDYVEVIEPDEHGLYCIGGMEWCWQEVVDPLAEGRKAFRRKAVAFYEAASELSEAWAPVDSDYNADEDPQAYGWYPTYLPSFDDFVADIGRFLDPSTKHEGSAQAS